MNTENGESERLHLWIPNFYSRAPAGSKTAEFFRDNLHWHLQRSKYYAIGRYPEALRTAFVEADQAWREVCGEDVDGSTAATALATPNEIFVANAGDGRAVMSVGGRAKSFNVEHSCTAPAEVARIKAAGGKIRLFGGGMRIDLEGPNCAIEPRAELSFEMAAKNYLSPTRAFGNFGFKMRTDLKPEAQVVTVCPDILSHKRTSEDELLILASDGIWDCLQPQKVVNFIRQRIGRGGGKHCLAPYSDDLVGQDNTTITIVALRQAGQTPADLRRSITRNRPGKGPERDDIEGITFIEFEDDLEAGGIKVRSSPNIAEAAAGVESYDSEKRRVTKEKAVGAKASKEDPTRRMRALLKLAVYEKQSPSAGEEFARSSGKGEKRARRKQSGNREPKRVKRH
ncbi:phosphatase 2C-like domain-containing protein [Mycena vulgaris]|nr:phosphatase 2C-like domain-containing protein [Mycena vulgaris]